MFSYDLSPFYGGNGGEFFEDDLTGVSQLVGVNIYAGNWINAQQAVWFMVDGSTRAGAWRGNPGDGEQSGFVLQPGEFITQVRCTWGDFVHTLSVTTSLNKVYGPFGQEEGPEWSTITAPVYGFAGRSGNYLDAVAFYTLARSGVQN